MAYYQGEYRQQGGGIGDIFSVLARTIIPAIARTAAPIIKNQARKLAPRALKAGVGLMSDLASKRNLKQALKTRGKRLISEAINQGPPAKRRQTNSNSRPKRSNALPKRKNNKRGARRKDIFS